jgi:hypothetical protein
MNQKVHKSNLLLPLIEASYRNEYTEYARRNLRCSDAGAGADEGDKCEREISYDFLMPGKKSLLTSGTLVLFEDGRLGESDIRNRLIHILRSPEREITDPASGARGKLDNMVMVRKLTLPVEGEPVHETPIYPQEDPILEIKTVNEWSFQAMAASGQVNQSYYDQVQEYLGITKTPWAILIIKNRNSSGPEPGALPFLEFVVYPDSERFAQIQAGLATTQECVNQKILPPRPFLVDSTKCQYCRYKYECWGERIRAKTPELKYEPAEGAGDAPGQEILEGAIRAAVVAQNKMKEGEKEYEEATSVIKQYFKVKGPGEIFVDNIKASSTKVEKTGLDKEKLKELIPNTLLIEVCEPNKKAIEQAIADRKCDASVLPAATVVVASYLQTRVTTIKEKAGRLTREQIEASAKKEKVDDKGDKRHKAAPEVGTSALGDKKGKSKKRSGISVGDRLLSPGSKNAGPKVERRPKGAVSKTLRRKAGVN